MFSTNREMLFDFFVRAMMLLLAMPVHECAHGLMANRLGDDTAARQGRLTLNPFAHLDPVGSVMLFLTGFGWGRPVEVDMRKFKNPRRDMALSALAGPLSNLAMAFAALILYKLLSGFIPFDQGGRAASVAGAFLGSAILINISLAVFNFLPVPPLDGSKILGALLPQKLYWAMLRYQRQISVIVMLLLITRILSPPLSMLTRAVLYGMDFLTRPIDALFLR